jgi:hypothetical protein
VSHSDFYEARLARALERFRTFARASGHGEALDVLRGGESVSLFPGLARKRH